MKKNISINVGGIIFHIEEDGYDKLRDYLSDINRYFESFEDSGEIIADIERRIAEIFLARLNENKQVITLDDIEALIKTMGHISDFEAAEGYNEEFHREPETHEHQESQQAHEFDERYEEKGGYRQSKKLYRDERRRLLGGVCSGMAHYLNVDPLWIRLLFLLALFDFIFDFTITGFVFLGYVILWVTVPGSYELEEDEKLRKLFRDSENRVLGGVATGLGAYFGVDPTIIRLLFVAGIFAGGLGIAIYLILWFITPEAKSITEKMQMQGEPITLSNIEKKIKDSLHIDDDDESLFAKILLFPFRLLAKVIGLLGNNLKPLTNFLFTVFSALIGVVLFIISLATTVALFIALGLFFGTINEALPYVSLGEIPIGLVQSSVPPVGLIFAFLTLWVPFLFVGILGLSLIAKRIVTSSIVNWGLLGIWIIGLIGAGVTLPIFFTEFQTSGTEKQVEEYSIPNDQILCLDAQHSNDDFSKVRLTVRGHNGGKVELVKWFESRGKTRQNAIENARNIQYQVTQSDSTLRFDSSYTLADGTPFRGQKIKLRLHVPYEKKFKMSRELGGILLNTLHPNGYKVRHLQEGHIWKYEEGRGLVCLNCEEEPENSNVDSEMDGTKDVFTFEGFSSVRIVGAYQVSIRPGDEYKLIAEGPSKAMGALKVTNDAGELLIQEELENISLGQGEEIKLTLYAPTLEEVKMEGAMKADIKNIEAKMLTLSMLGAVDCDANLEVGEMNLEATGASKVQLRGKAKHFEVQLLGTSMLQAYDFQCENVVVKALGLTEAKVFASESIDIVSSFGSNIDYKGNPKNVYRDSDEGTE